MVVTMLGMGNTPMSTSVLSLSHVQFLMLLLSLTNRPRGAWFIDT